MKRVIYLIIIFSLTASFSYSQSIETRDIKGFTKLSVMGKMRCEIFPSETEKVEISIKGSEPGNIITVVEDGTLNIRMKTNTPTDAIIKVKVFYKDIKNIVSQSQALIVNQDTLRSAHMDFVAKTGGKMELKLKLESLSADVKQGATMVFSGEVGKQEIQATSGGIYSAYELESEDSYVKANSGGKAKVVSNRIIDATASSKAFIGYQGKPASTYIKTSMGGEIQHTMEEDD